MWSSTFSQLNQKADIMQKNIGPLHLQNPTLWNLPHQGQAWFKEQCSALCFGCLRPWIIFICGVGQVFLSHEWICASTNLTCYRKKEWKLNNSIHNNSTLTSQHILKRFATLKSVSGCEAALPNLQHVNASEDLLILSGSQKLSEPRGIITYHHTSAGENRNLR